MVVGERALLYSRSEGDARPKRGKPRLMGCHVAFLPHSTAFRHTLKSSTMFYCICRLQLATFPRRRDPGLLEDSPPLLPYLAERKHHSLAYIQSTFLPSHCEVCFSANGELPDETLLTIRHSFQRARRIRYPPIYRHLIRTL